MTLKPKLKPCSSCGQPRPRWKGTLCRQCASIEAAQASSDGLSPLSKGKGPLGGKSRSTGLRRRSEKRTNTDLFLQEHFGFKSQVEMFDYLWENSPPVCWYTGRDLRALRDNPDMRHHCCAHVLPKGKYPLFKLNPENMALVHPEFHRIVDQGTEAEREKHPGWRWRQWDRKVEEMKQEYEEFKEKYLL